MRLLVASIMVMAFIVPSFVSARSSWPAADIAGSMNLGDGTVRAGVFVETAAVTGTEAACEGQWIFVTAAITRTLCAVGTAGQSVCYLTTGNNVLTIDPAGSDVIVLNGVAQTGGVSIVSSGTEGEFVCLISDGTSWFTLGVNGTIAQGA